MPCRDTDARPRRDVAGLVGLDREGVAVPQARPVNVEDVPETVATVAPLRNVR